MLKNRMSKVACIYCGKMVRLKSKGDHIPPKSFFKNTDRKKLISVPSCQKCNNEGSVYDCYLKERLSLRMGNVGAEYALSKTISSILGDSKKQKDILSNLGKDVYLFSTSNLFVGKGIEYFVDFEKAKIALNRYVQALCYYEFDRIFDKKTTIRCYPLLDKISNQYSIKLKEYVRACKKRNIKDVFKYGFLTFNEGLNSFWILEFYQKSSFIFFVEQT